CSTGCEKMASRRPRRGPETASRVSPTSETFRQPVGNLLPEDRGCGLFCPRRQTGRQLRARFRRVELRLERLTGRRCRAILNLFRFLNDREAVVFLGTAAPSNGSLVAAWHKSEEVLRADLTNPNRPISIPIFCSATSSR